MERRPAQVVNAFVAGGAIGAAGGAALGSSLAIGWAWGALIGAVVIGTGEAVTDVTRIRGRAKPLWWRITSATVLAAIWQRPRPR